MEDNLISLKESIAVTHDEFGRPYPDPAAFCPAQRSVQCDGSYSSRGTVFCLGLSLGVQSELQDWRETVGPSDATKFVFGSERGTPLGKQNIWNRNMRPRLKLAGLEWANFQVMRRTFSTLGKAAGGDPKALADQAGHDIGVSINVYMQTPLEGKLELVRNLEKFILG